MFAFVVFVLVLQEIGWEERLWNGVSGGTLNLNWINQSFGALTLFVYVMNGTMPLFPHNFPFHNNCWKNARKTGWVDWLAVEPLGLVMVVWQVLMCWIKLCTRSWTNVSCSTAHRLTRWTQLRAPASTFGCRVTRRSTDVASTWPKPPTRLSCTLVSWSTPLLHGLWIYFLLSFFILLWHFILVYFSAVTRMYCSTNLVFQAVAKVIGRDQVLYPILTNLDTVLDTLLSLFWVDMHLVTNLP